MNMEKPQTCDNENYSHSAYHCLWLMTQCFEQMCRPAKSSFLLTSCFTWVWCTHLGTFVPLCNMTHAHDTCILPSYTAKRSVDCKSYRVNHKHRSYCAQASNTSVTSRLGRARAVFRLTLINRPKAIVGLPSVFFSSRWDPRLGRTAKFVHTKEQMRSTISSVSEILPALRQYLPQSHSEPLQVNVRNKLPRANNAK